MNTIICAAYNNCELTKATHESLINSTNEKAREILVNNGSTDDTQKWIDFVAGTEIEKGSKVDVKWRDLNPKGDGLLTEGKNFPGITDVTFVNNLENKGCGIGRNVGARLVSEDSDYVTFVDNDIYAPYAWDTEMIRFMNAHPDVGICGPMTNFAGTPQLLDKMKFAHLGHPLPEKVEDIEPFAYWFRSRYKDQWSYVPRGFVIIGFCMMIRKKCFDQLKYPDGSLFDERFKYYGKEDNDLCIRATQAGWKLAYFGGCYVHHWGSKSLDALAQSGVDWGAEWRKNDKAFEEKWT